MGAQSELFAGFQWRAFTGMLASPTRGLVFFAPAALFGIWGMKRRFLDPEARWTPYLAAACLSLIAFISFRTTWTGGNTFGTRYYASVCVVLALFIGDMEEGIASSPRLRALWAAAFGTSVVVHAIGAFFTWPGSRFIPPQIQELWQVSLYPPVHIFLEAGPLYKLPAAVRIVAAAAILGVGAGAAWLQHRFLPPSRSGGR